VTSADVTHMTTTAPMSNNPILYFHPISRSTHLPCLLFSSESLAAQQLL
jgi:hypothetical protein